MDMFVVLPVVYICNMFRLPSHQHHDRYNRTVAERVDRLNRDPSVVGKQLDHDTAERPARFPIQRCLEYLPEYFRLVQPKLLDGP